MNLAASEVFDTDDIDVEDWMVPQPVVHTDTGNPKHHVETAVMSGATDEPLGRQEGKTLTWRNVTMTLAAHGEKPERELLSDVWGELPPHTTTAIMGPSGAGKTTLLNILSGRARSRGHITVKADLRLDNYTMDPTKIEVRKQIAFVAQENSLQVTSTPREAIRFSAKLRLSRDTSETALDELIEQMIEDLGLTSCADTIVGGALIKGISGGECKRTSVGVELVVKPKMIFLDEPTSGLDSYSAVQLCQVLKKVAHSGAGVLFTIHQPSSEIFNSFDNLILMNKGRVMYQGPVAKVPEYFELRQHPVPAHYNPADFIMNVAQSVPEKELVEYGFYPHDDRDMGEPFAPKDGQDALGGIVAKLSTVTGKLREKGPPGTIVQTTMLFNRELQNLRRDVSAIAVRFGMTTFMSILVGVIFLDVGETDTKVNRNLQSHFGAMIMVLMMSMFGTAQPALVSFPAERPVFLREYSTNHYSVVSYFVSRLSMEALITALQVLVMVIVTYWLIGLQGGFPIVWATVYSTAMASTALAVFLACSVEEPKLGIELMPLLFVPQMLFAGFFVTPTLIPVWLRWARYICTLTYSIRIFLVAEFGDCAKREPGCATLLEGIDAHSDETWWNWLVLVLLFALFRLSALIVLRKKATKFF